MWSASASLVCLERADICATCGLVAAAPGRQAVRPTPRVPLKRLQRASVVSAHAAGGALGCMRSAALVLIPETGMTQGRRLGSAFQVRRCQGQTHVSCEARNLHQLRFGTPVHTAIHLAFVESS